MRILKTFSLVLLVALVPLLGVWASGTGETKGSTGAAAAPVRIVFSTGKDTTNTNPKIVEAFNSTHKDVQIDYVEQPPSTTDQHDKYATMFAAKDSSIDVIAADIPWTPEFGSAGWLLRLDTMPGYQDVSATDFPGPLLGTTYKGSVYAIPWFNNAGVLFYRTDLLENAGIKPPQTFDELIAAAQKLQGPNMAGFVWQGFQYEGLVCDWLEYLWGMGGSFMDNQTGRVTVDSPQGVQSVQLMADLIHKYKISPESVLTFKENESYAVFLSGNAVFVRAWPSFYVNANTATGTKVAGITGIEPMVHAPGQKPGSCLGTWNVAISNFTKHPQQAWEVVQYLASFDAQKMKALGGGNPPARREVYNDKDVLAKFPFFATLSTVMNTALPRPVAASYPQISAEAIQPNLFAALTGKMTAQEAVKAIKAQTEAILAKGM